MSREGFVVAVAEARGGRNCSNLRRRRSCIYTEQVGRRELRFETDGGVSLAGGRARDAGEEAEDDSDDEGSVSTMPPPYFSIQGVS